VTHKLYGVLTSDLVWSSRIRYLGAVLLRRWGVAERAHKAGGSGTPAGKIFYRLKGGVPIGLRRGSSDFQVFEEVFIERVYARFARLLPLNRTIVDLGANIGLSAVFLGRAAPESPVVAVEPDAGNFEMLVENLRGAGLGDRARAVRAFAGREPGFAAIEDSGNGEWGLRMGARYTGTRRMCTPEADVPVIPIADLVDGSGPVSVKCDIEGAERELFSRLPEWEALVGLMILELHTELFPADELDGILQASGFELTVHGEIPAGASIAWIALERKSRKAPERSAALAPLYVESA
jgi:FkbM family methyltransferase